MTEVRSFAVLAAVMLAFCGFEYMGRFPELGLRVPVVESLPISRFGRGQTPHQAFGEIRLHNTHSPGQRPGIEARILHKDHVSLRSGQGGRLSGSQKVHRDAKASILRAQLLNSRRKSLRASEAVNEFRAAKKKKYNFGSPLSDAAPAEYLMSLSLGTPAQNFVVVVDTGSDLSWLQCDPCYSCFEEDEAVFDPKFSSSYRNLSCHSGPCKKFIHQYGPTFITGCHPNCQFYYRYSDHSITRGEFSTEILTVRSIDGQNISGPTIAFGCAHDSFSPSQLYDDSNGIVGLGQGLISFPSQLGFLYGDKFSYCLVNRRAATVQSSLILFGELAVPTDASVQYTPILENRHMMNLYFVGLEGIAVDGKLLNISSKLLAIDRSGRGGTFFDSGTTFTQLLPAAYDALADALASQIRYNPLSVSTALELCYDVTGLQMFQVPSIAFHFIDARFYLPFANSYILINHYPHRGNLSLCLAMQRAPLGSASIIGNTQQRDFQILYDRQHKRIGFVEMDCSSLK